MENIILDTLTGMIIGDAFGKMHYSPHPEKTAEEDIKDFPPDIENLIWSEKTGFALCVAEAIKHNLNKKLVLELFQNCLEKQYWTIVDEENTIPSDFKKIIKSHISQGRTSEISKQNSQLKDNFLLLQIIPLSFYVFNLPLTLRYSLIRDIVTISSPYIPSLITSFYLEEFINNLLKGDSLLSVYYTMQEVFPLLLKKLELPEKDIELLWRLLFRDIWNYEKKEIHPGEDSISTLEATIWVIFNSDSYISALKQAVSLGGDTITLSALVGALAGILYTAENIPKNWQDKIQHKNRLLQLTHYFNYS